MCFNSLEQQSPFTPSDSSPSPHPLGQPTSQHPTSIAGTMPHEGSVRKRVVRACEVCRRKKVKCNGQKPCSHCIAFVEQCVYVDVKDRSAYSRRYVESLELRLARLEKAWAMAFESGGCGGMCQWREGKDVMRRASDPGAGAATRLQMPGKLGQDRSLSSPMVQSVSNGRGESISNREVLDPPGHADIHRFVEDRTGESRMDLTRRGPETRSSTPQTHIAHSGKSREPDECKSLSLDNGRILAGQASSSKRMRSATLPQNRSLETASSILRSETAPPPHTAQSQPPPPPSHVFYAPQAAQIPATVPLTFQSQTPTLPTSMPIQWPTTVRATGNGAGMPTSFACGVGLDDLWRDQTSMLPVLPSQPQQQQQHSSARATQPIQPQTLQPNQEEMMVGLLQEFMNQQRS